MKISVMCAAHPAPSNCIEALMDISKDANDLDPKPKRKRGQTGTRWIPNECKCRSSNVVAQSRLNSLLGVPYIAIIGEDLRAQVCVYPLFDDSGSI
jgi:hypothetical protein